LNKAFPPNALDKPLPYEKDQAQVRTIWRVDPVILAVVVSPIAQICKGCWYNGTRDKVFLIQGKLSKLIG
jgi:hypothetical protein